jgi:transposase-like protein
MNLNDIPETLQGAITYFADKQRAFEFMTALRWPDGVVKCGRCGCDSVLFMPSVMRWNCRGCRKQFSVKVGTVFEDSPLGLETWLPALWLIVNAKNGISSCEVARALDVTQKTAWFMLQRIRLAMQSGTVVKMGGQVEVDETFIGGRARKMNAKQKARRNIKTSTKHLSPVQGLLERSKDGQKASRIVLQHTERIDKAALDGNVRKYVLRGSVVNTDQSFVYDKLDDEYVREVINHAECYAKGKVHVNGLENFWSLLKRTIRGTYVSVEPFHLFRYLDEQAFRFNERKDGRGDKGRFLKAMAGVIGKRLTWAKLTAENDALPAGASV